MRTTKTFYIGEIMLPVELFLHTGTLLANPYVINSGHPLGDIRNNSKNAGNRIRIHNRLLKLALEAATKPLCQYELSVSFELFNSLIIKTNEKWPSN
jgi:hypothetical protein